MYKVTAQVAQPLPAFLYAVFSKLVMQGLLAMGWQQHPGTRPQQQSMLTLTGRMVCVVQH